MPHDAPGEDIIYRGKVKLPFMCSVFGDVDSPPLVGSAAVIILLTNSSDRVSPDFLPRRFWVFIITDMILAALHTRHAVCHREAHLAGFAS